MPRKWMKFSDKAQRLMRKWYEAMDEEIPPELREPGDVEPATESKPAATEQVATESKPVATEPVVTESKPVATEQVATEPTATEPAASAKGRRSGNKLKWPKLAQMVRQAELKPKDLLKRYIAETGQTPPLRTVQDYARRFRPPK
jgi:hypothetical protein